MTQRLRRTLTGVGLAFSLTLLVTPAAQATRTSSAKASRAVHSAPSGLFHAIWQFLLGDNPHELKPTLGPTVDPNGLSIH
jgi:non-ribosomal peptide synthetase component F